MKLDDLIAHHVGETCLDPVLVKGFLQTSPHYHQWGLHRQLDQTSLDQLNATDLIEFYLRLYLTGRHKTLQAVLREVREFVHKDPSAAYHLIRYSLGLTRQHLLILEWYELLPRLEHAQEKIAELTSDVVNYLPPQVLSFLEKSY